MIIVINGLIYKNIRLFWKYKFGGFNGGGNREKPLIVGISH